MNKRNSDEIWEKAILRGKDVKKCYKNYQIK